MILRLWHILIWIGCCSISGEVFALALDTLSPPRPWRTAISVHGGFVIPHSNIIQPLVTSHAGAASIFCYRPAAGNRAWHHAYAIPEQGIDLTFIYTGNPKQLGSQVALSYLLQLPITHKDRSASDHRHAFFQRYRTQRRTFFTMGIGLGYAMKHWDQYENHQAAVLGSSLNIALNLQVMHRRHWDGIGDLGIGARIIHLSNGAYQLPNLGTNTASVFLQYTPHRHAHDLTPSMLPEFRDSIFAHFERTKWSLALTTGWKEIPPPGGAKYQAVSMQLLHEHRHRVKSSWGYGLDAFYNRSLLAVMNRNADTSYAFFRPLQVGAVVGFNLHFNRFELKMQQGVYLLDKWKGDGRFYHRVGLRYRFGESWFAQLTLKTHFAKADFGELGIGYCWSRSRQRRSHA